MESRTPYQNHHHHSTVVTGLRRGRTCWPYRVKLMSNINHVYFIKLFTVSSFTRKHILIVVYHHFLQVLLVLEILEILDFHLSLQEHLLKQLSIYHILLHQLHSQLANRHTMNSNQVFLYPQLILEVHVLQEIQVFLSNQGVGVSGKINM